MNLYLISQEENDGYDTYDSAIVAAIDENTARYINPRTGDIIKNFYENFKINGDWCTDLKFVKCNLIGYAEDHVKQGVILASYNAG